MTDNEETQPEPPKFDFSAYPPDSLFHDRRNGHDRRAEGDADTSSAPDSPTKERRQKKERRRRVDPTTFEKQYSDDELEFMNAMQAFKVRTGRTFPTHGEVLRVAVSLGYRKTSPQAPEEDEGISLPDGF
jgi:hypothetical protein